MIAELGATDLRSGPEPVPRARCGTPAVTAMPADLLVRLEDGVDGPSSRRASATGWVEQLMSEPAVQCQEEQDDERYGGLKQQHSSIVQRRWSVNQ
ncbi:hypothetical protein [Nonomuraea sp. NPDC049784]|uniref:hypothetical protein n=1 Tax=Nonomuraea sp. NPDC049784 TaxID=3154361 RepID=UPI0033D091EA